MPWYKISFWVSNAGFMYMFADVMVFIVVWDLQLAWKLIRV